MKRIALSASPRTHVRLHKTIRSVLSVTPTLIAILGAAPVAIAADSRAPDADLETIIVTGTRQINRTVAESMAPIDVISAESLQTAGVASARDVLGALLPSLNTNQFTGGVGGAVRVVQLRGLNSDQTLILVNGKRRHGTASIFATSNTGVNGQSPADIDLIPASSIARIEVLRDGASAQYGSDAIAGVINIVQKSDLSNNVTVGGAITSRHDGREGNLQANVGIPVTSEGQVQLFFDGHRQGYTNRSGPNPSRFFALLPNGSLDPREATVDRNVNRQGQPKVNRWGGGYNASIQTGAVEVYSFGTYADRWAANWQSFRVPSNPNNSLAIYPNGFMPLIVVKDKDYQLVAGVRGDAAAELNFDLSTSYSKSEASYEIQQSLNPGLGAASPTEFYLGTAKFDEWTTNLDLQRGLDIGLSTPLSAAVGLEYRRNTYSQTAGTPYSYLLTGSQGEGGFPASAEGEWSRSNWGVYVDLEQKLSDVVEVALAGRHERYSDFGSKNTGKASIRVAPSEMFAVRGTVSVGFRAPSLQQQHYTAASNRTVVINGQAANVPFALVTVNSAAGRILGATELRPETSHNYSLGAVFTPSRDLNFTVDAYQIDVKNRIFLTSNFLGQVVVDALVASGITNAAGGYYFTNGADTRSRGLDAVLTYNTTLGDFADARFSLSGNINKTSFRRISPTPPILANAGIPFIGRDRIGFFSVAMPRQKVIGDVNLNRDRWSLNLRATYFGHIDVIATVPANDERVPSAVVADAQIGYDVLDDLTWLVGVNNIFDKFPPERLPANQLQGTLQYNLYAPYGSKGRIYYTRLSWNF